MGLQTAEDAIGYTTSTTSFSVGDSKLITGKVWFGKRRQNNQQLIISVSCEDIYSSLLVFT